MYGSFASTDSISAAAICSVKAFISSIERHMYMRLLNWFAVTSPSLRSLALKSGLSSWLTSTSMAFTERPSNIGHASTL